MTDDPARSATQQAVGTFGEFLAWVRNALSDDQVRAQVLRDLGVDPSIAVSQAPEFGPHPDSIERYRTTVDSGAEAFKEAIEDLTAMAQSVRDVVDAVHVGTEQTTDELLHDLFRLLSLNYLRIRFPLAFWIGRAGGFIEESFSAQRVPGPIGRGVLQFLEHPIDHFKRVYGDAWPIRTQADAEQLSAATLAPLAVAAGFLTKYLYAPLERLHVEQPTHRVLYGWEASPESTTPVGDALNSRTLSFYLAGMKTLAEVPPAPTDPCTSPTESQPLPSLGALLSFSLNWVPAEHGGPGMFVAVGGSGTLTVPIQDGWTFSVEVSSAEALDFLITGWETASIGGPADASLKFALERGPNPSGPAVLTLNDGARLEFEAFSFQVGLDSGGLTMAVHARNGALVVASDPVTARASATETLRIGFNLGLLFADGRFSLEGGSGLRATLPLNQSLGPLTFQSLTLELSPSSAPNTPDLRIEVSTGVVVRLGTVTFTVDRIGLAGAAQLWSAIDLGVKPPSGIGVEIGATVIRGGGYLFYDPAKEQYAGILDLDLQDLFTVKAIGLLNTRLPDGKPGFSFLVILAVENFTPLNLGLGFRLTGLGGIFGSDRTVSMDALEAGLKAHALDRIMFPPDPVGNAPAIVSVAGSVFPPARDHVIVGPMVQIVWGADEIVTIEVAVIFEFPTPGRLFILGKLRALLPAPQSPVVRIEVDVIGEIDFGRKQAFAHAVLVDSSIGGFPLSGAAALLMRWGDDPVFVLAFGGVNPRYEHFLPTGFPKLERLSVPLTRGNNPRIRLDLYIACTSNSFQIGGRLEIFASIGKFSIEGLLAIDALIQDDEPSYLFDFVAKLQLKAWGTNLFAVKFEGSLAGSHPWHVRGKASFSIWIFDYSIDVDHTFGAPAPPPPLPAVDVRPAVLAALADARSWRAQPPQQGLNPVTLRTDAVTTDLLVHPLGQLAVTQRVVPLGIAIDRVGNGRPTGARLFTIDRALVGGTPVATAPLNEQFARAQFFDLTDEEKLTSPPFESMPAGVQIGSSGLSCGPGAEADAEYDTLIYDAVTGQSVSDAPYTPDASRMESLARVGLKVPLGAKYRAPGPTAQIAAPRYIVTSTDDMAIKSMPGLPAEGVRTYTEAVMALRANLAEHPQQASALQLVTTSG